MKRWFKIGEIAKLYNIGTDTIRYYEKRGLVKPIRSESGYRLYDLNCIYIFNTIRDLRKLNFSTEQICEFLKDRTVSSSIELLECQQKQIKRYLEEFRSLLNNVEDRLEKLHEASELPLGKIELKHLKVRRCFVIHQGYLCATGDDIILMQNLVNFAPESLFLIGNNQIGSMLDAEQAARSERTFYDSVFIFDKNGDFSLIDGDWLTVCYRGSYTQTSLYAKKLLSYAREHGLVPCGKLIELAWVDHYTTTKQEELITELQLPVQKAEV